MKVTFVLNSTNAGGAEVHALRLASHFFAQHDVQVIALREADENCALDSGILKVSVCPERGLIGMRRWLARALGDAGADVVISVNVKPLVMVQVSGMARRHISIFHSFPSHLFGQGARMFGAATCWLLAATLLASRVSRFIYVGAMQQRAWRMVTPFSIRPGTFIHNGVPVPPKVKEKESSDSLRIAMVAAFRKEKNHSLLLDALAILRDRNIRFEAAFAGDGALRSQVEQRANELGLEGYVTFLGSLKDCSRVYQWADVTVLPSTAETLPLVIAESMSFATPVVASEVGGNREIVISGRNGILFPSGDLDALVNALLAMTNCGAREEMGGSARRSVIDQFSIDRMFESYDRQLDGVLNGS